MAKVAVLSEELVNKIAAGEVVERPASVVKELCENSVDAGARTVRVALAGGGLSSICVTDDGHGMSREDAQLALHRHATSKLFDLEGLFRISTKGFRGEALPAIASVSRFTLTTSEPNAPLGTRLHIDGGEAPTVEDAPASGGTRIDVDELFFNTPARRKFMRREQTELSHCEEALVRLALAHPEVSFFLAHEGRELFTSPACEADPKERIASALGKDVHPHLLEVDERRLGIRVHGWVASPEYTLPSARGLYAFVNHRFVRDRGLHHAMVRAFQDALPPGRQPVGVLFVEMDPRAVDVNVHPQKLEVRFADGRGVHDAVLSAVSRALKTSVHLMPVPGGPSETLPGAHYASAVERFLSRASADGLSEPLFTPVAAEPPPAYGQARPSLNEAPPPGYFTQLRYLGTLGKRFFVCEGRGGTLVVVDPHAALERVRLGELVRHVEGPPAAAQPSLFTTTVELPPEAAKAITARRSSLARLGLTLSPFGGSSFALESVPPSLVGIDHVELLVELSRLLPAGEANVEELLPAVRLLACHAVGSLREMSQEEVAGLFAELDRSDFHASCLHGQVVVSETPFLELCRRAGS
ncbi:MAG: DNA mismatch repair endonuclease MutL [Myxococcota bacterium]